MYEGSLTVMASLLSHLSPKNPRFSGGSSGAPAESPALSPLTRRWAPHKGLARTTLEGRRPNRHMSTEAGWENIALRALIVRRLSGKGAAAMEALVTSLLGRYLRLLIVDFSKEQLDIQALKGSVDLKDVDLVCSSVQEMLLIPTNLLVRDGGGGRGWGGREREREREREEPRRVGTFFLLGSSVPLLNVGAVREGTGGGLVLGGPEARGGPVGKGSLFPPVLFILPVSSPLSASQVTKASCNALKIQLPSVTQLKKRPIRLEVDRVELTLEEPEEIPPMGTELRELLSGMKRDPSRKKKERDDILKNVTYSVKQLSLELRVRGDPAPVRVLVQDFRLATCTSEGEETEEVAQARHLDAEKNEETYFK